MLRGEVCTKIEVEGDFRSLAACIRAQEYLMLGDLLREQMNANIDCALNRAAISLWKRNAPMSGVLGAVNG